MKRTIVLLLALLAGCGPGTSELELRAPGYPGVIYEFRLSDGTRCVATKLGYSGGLTCNWKQTE